MNLLKSLGFKFLIFIVSLTALVFATDNSEAVALVFMGSSSGEWPVSWWVLGAFVVGVLCGGMLNLRTNASLRLAVRKANKQVSQTNQVMDHAKATGVDSAN